MTARRMTRDEWLARGRELYGDDPRAWKFRCVMCGNVQSAVSVDERNPTLVGKRKDDWIFFSCEGRHTEGVGCDWTLGGLFRLHRLEVVWPADPDAGADHAKETVHITFEFADDPVGDWEPCR